MILQALLQQKPVSRINPRPNEVATRETPVEEEQPTKQKVQQHREENRPRLPRGESLAKVAPREAPRLHQHREQDAIAKERALGAGAVEAEAEAEVEVLV